MLFVDRAHFWGSSSELDDSSQQPATPR